MGERQPVDERQMPQALPEVLIAGLFRVHQLRHGAAAAEIRHQPWPFPASPRSKRKVSATSPGPKAMATPRPASPAVTIRASTNISVAEDMLPKSRRSEEHQSELPSLMPHSYAVFCLTKKNY